LGKISRLMLGFRQWWKKRFGPPQRDKRKSPRKPFQIKVTNLKSGFFTYYLSSDISAGGMFLQTQEPLPKGTPLDLQFSLPNRNQPLKFQAEVVRVVPPSPDSPLPSGMGIRFVNLAEDIRRQIREFVELPI